MTSISIPLQLTPKGLATNDKLKQSIDAVVKLIVTTERFSTPADPQFGYTAAPFYIKMRQIRNTVPSDTGAVRCQKKNLHSAAAARSVIPASVKKQSPENTAFSELCLRSNDGQISMEPDVI